MLFNSREDKKKFIVYLNKFISETFLIIVVNILKMSSNEMNDLRFKARKYNVHIKVIKNSLATLAFKETNHCDISEKLTDSIFLVFVNKNFSEISQLLYNYEKNKKLTIKSFSLGDGIKYREDFNKLLTLPTDYQAKVQFLFFLKQLCGLKLKFIICSIYVKVIKQCLMLSNKKNNNLIVR